MARTLTRIVHRREHIRARGHDMRVKVVAAPNAPSSGDTGSGVTPQPRDGMTLGRPPAPIRGRSMRASISPRPTRLEARATETLYIAADDLLLFKSTTDPRFVGLYAEDLHPQDLRKLETELLDFLAAVENEWGWFIPPDKWNTTAIDIRRFGVRAALYRAGKLDSFDHLPAPDPREKLQLEARQMSTIELHLDADGFPRLYPAD